jgi:hypothetical protein
MSAQSRLSPNFQCRFVSRRTPRLWVAFLASDRAQARQSINSIQVRILWDSFLGHRRPSRYDFSDDTVQEIRQTFVKALEARVPAMSITGHT